MTPPTPKMSDTPIYFLLPLQWSLHFFLTDKEWRRFRDRVKAATPDWDRCSCPRQCKANTADEVWQYDDTDHVKRFLRVQFLCPGCHWLKSPPWRIETWLKIQKGLLPPLGETDHISTCLGWTPEQVAQLREQDLDMHRHEIEEMERIVSEAHAGRAHIQYWTVDLEQMSRYGYTRDQIAEYSHRMNTLDRRRPSRK